MAGFALKEGKYENRDVSEDELWSAIACIFTTKSKNDSSYKFGFLKSILDNLNNADENLLLTFDQLFMRFTEIYWDLILKYNLRQKKHTNDNRNSAIENILLELKDMYEMVEFESFDNLQPQVRIKVAHKVKMKCKTYVVGALFEDTKRLFYSFSKKGEWIRINPQMYEFICIRKKEIETLNSYEWAHFLEKVNKDYSANDILTQCIPKTEISQINTVEMLYEAEETERNELISHKKNQMPLMMNSDSKAVSEGFDEEIRSLLDDPVELIKILKKRQGICR